MLALRTSLRSRRFPRLLVSQVRKNARASHSDITNYEPQKSPEEHWLKKLSHQKPLPILSSQAPSPGYVRHHEDQVIARLSQSRDIIEVLCVVRDHLKEFEEEHLVQCFKKINLLSKQERTLNYEDLHHHPDFINLCSTLRKKTPVFISNNSLISCLKTLVFLKVQSDSKIISNLLFNLKSRINNLTLQELLFLDVLLGNMEGQLVEALKIALPIVSESQLNFELPSANFTTAVKLLQFYSKKGVPMATQKKVVQHLMTFSDEKWSGVDCQNVIRALMNWTLVKEVGAVPLLQKSLEDMATNIQECRPVDIGWLLGKCVTLYAVKRPYWFNERLCKAVADRALKENWSAEDTYSVVLALAKFKIFHPELLEFFAAKLGSSSLLGRKGDFTFYIIKAFSQSNYLPQNFQKIRMKLFSPANVNKVNKFEKPDRWIRLAFHSAVLGIYEENIISQVFEKSFLEQNLTTLDILAIDILNHSVQIEYPAYQGPFPDSHFLDNSRKLFQPSCSPIRKTLEVALGGVNYVSHDLFTKWGHYIEHVVAIGPDNNYLKLEYQQGQVIDDLIIPQEFKVVLVKVFQPFDYFVNTNRLLGVHNMEMRTLKSAGYRVIEVNCRILKQLTEQERLPYLLQLIHYNASEVE